MNFKYILYLPRDDWLHLYYVIILLAGFDRVITKIF